MTQHIKGSGADIPKALRDFPVFNFLVREPRLVSFADRLDALGVLTVGDFLKCGEDTIFRKIRTTANNRMRVRKIFASLDL